MGCGTGDLADGEQFTIKLRFNEMIPRNHAVYTHFEDAVRGLLQGRLGAWHAFPETGGVETVRVVVRGPLEGVDRRRFNRAMNRLLWGVRFMCPGGGKGGHPLPSDYSVNMVSIQKDGEKSSTSPTWTDEDTCSIGSSKSPRMPRAKSTPKRKR